MRTNILITGASAGLGAEMARQFAAKGRNLALCARRKDRLDELREELAAAHPEIKISVRELDVDDNDAVFKVFHAFASEFGTLDRVVVNAGIGKGQPIGTGGFEPNRQTAMTNFVSALAQCEAAMEIFRRQNAGHLVVISSVSAIRGMRGNAATYAATKAGISSLAEGIRSDVLDTVFEGHHAPLVSTSGGSQPHLRGTGRDPATGTHRTGPCQPNATKRVKSGEAEQLLPRRLFVKIT